VLLPTGAIAPPCQIESVRIELQRVREALARLVGGPLGDDALTRGIGRANRVRRLLAELRKLNFTAAICPLPALEMLIAEMLAIHFCSDQNETIAVLEELLMESGKRVAAGTGVLPADAVRVFWVNPVADLRVMNLLEACGGRICGTEYLFTHALDVIPEDVEPMEALARTALGDPMAGCAAERADRICRDAVTFGSEAVLISRIPGASHCATEGTVIAEVIRSRLDIPVCEIEVPSVSDALHPTIRTRLEALLETARRRRR
jgi:benzoyl-CoA reductase/2-hydroxyglutaryl-CoA dehydratase subunit BcrC/BadD/HgdB